MKFTGIAAAMLLCGQSYAVPALLARDTKTIFSQILSIFSNMLDSDDEAWYAAL